MGYKISSVANHASLARLRLSRLQAGLIMGFISLVILFFFKDVIQSSEMKDHRGMDRMREFFYGQTTEPNTTYTADLNATLLTADVDADSQTEPLEPPRDPQQEVMEAKMREILSEAYENERLRLLDESNFNPIRIASDLRAANVFDPSLQKYITRLRTFVAEWFDGLDSQPYLDRVLDDLTHHIPPPLQPEVPMRKVVISTAKGGWAGIDEKYFPAWQETLGPVGWDVEVADDEMMDEWFAKLTEGKGAGTLKWRRVWDSLSAPVFKSDLLRLLAILTWGGIYSDSDTRPRSHPYLWGNDGHSILPASLGPLGDLLNGLPRRSHPPPTFIPQSGQMNASAPTYADKYSGINMPDVALVVSMENDNHIRGNGLDETCAREMQLFQSTFMAKPFHPVLLDALERVVTNIEMRMERTKVTHHGDSQVKNTGNKFVLDLTGPGPFSDAIWQYLLIQYGFSPLDMRGSVDKIARVGDTIILPRSGFAQPFPQENEWDKGGPHPEERAVAHHFLGRWKQ